MRKSTCAIMMSIFLSFQSGEVHSDPEPSLRLKRKVDPVVIDGKHLKRLHSTSLSNLRLLVFTGKNFQSIPFQIDEKYSNGSYIFDDDTKLSKDKGRLDRNDELVFMARDSGARPPQTVLADYAKQNSAQILEIELAAFRRKKLRKAWVYLSAFRHTPPKLSVKQYVSISYKDGVLSYRGNNFSIDNSLADGNTLRNSSLRFLDRTNKLSRNLLDTNKMHGKLYYYGIPVTRNGMEIRAKVGASIRGPIRCVIRNDIEVKIIWGFWIRTSNSIGFFYDFGTVSPTNFDFPINIDKSPVSKMRMSTDLSKSAQGWYFYNNYNTKPLKLDGKMSSQERKLNKKFPLWNLVYGPEGGFMQRLIFEDKTIVKRPNSQLFFQDDALQADGPENEEGSHGNTGFVVDFSGTKVGSYKATYYSYYSNRLQYGDERKYLNIVDRPIKTKVRSASLQRQ